MTETAQPKRGGKPFHSIRAPHFDFIRAAGMEAVDVRELLQKTVS